MRTYLLRSPVTGEVMVGVLLNGIEVVLTKAAFLSLMTKLQQTEIALKNVGGQQWSKPEEERLLAGKYVVGE